MTGEEAGEKESSIPTPAEIHVEGEVGVSDEYLEDEEEQKQKEEEEELVFEDHFSLRSPSSTVRYRNYRFKVYEQANDQFLLEERKDDKTGKRHITVKRMRVGSFGLRMLRASYTLVALLMLGFLFVFCVQVALFQLLEIPAGTGVSSTGPLDVERLIAAILALPLFVYGMASLMAMGTAFVGDTWNGSLLLRTMLGWSVVTVEWLCFLVYLAVPLFTIIVLLFLRVGNFWEIGAGTWFICVFAPFVVFAVLVLFNEISLCLRLVKIEHPGEGALATVKNAVLLTQSQRLAGVRDEKHLVRYDHEDRKLVESEVTLSLSEPVTSVTGPYSRTTVMECNRAFTRVEPPERRYTIDEVREMEPFITNTTWSLEKMFCRSRNSPAIYAVTGENALQESQFLSSLVCSVIGLCLMCLLIVSFLVWMGQGTMILILVVICFVLGCIVPATCASIGVFRTYGTMRSAKKNQVDSDESTMYQVWRTYTISKPVAWYSWFRFGIDMVFFFLWPLISMYAKGMNRSGTLFLFLGLFSSLRIYFDAGWVLSKIGSISQVAVANGTYLGKLDNVVGTLSESSSKEAALYEQAKTSEILGKVTRARSVLRWTLVFGGFALFFLLAVIQGANEETTPQGGRPPFVMVDDFYYPPQPDLPYQSCKLTKNFGVPGQQGFSYLFDYSILAMLAYETPTVSEYVLEKWFGTSIVDEVDFVNYYRNETGTLTNDVSFKLFSIPMLPGRGVVSVRGTQVQADALFNYQLWLSSMLAQLVRLALPLGWIWNPILDDLVTVVNWVEGDQTKKGSYYIPITQFVNDLLENNYTYDGKSFDTIRLTGTSLGGGLAMISAGQTNASAVSMCGPNAVLARHTFLPPVTMDALNTRTLNVIPDRDFNSRIGDTARLYQKIDCKAPLTDLFGCHGMYRTLCELLYTCGSGPRPIMCMCVETYGYPEPVQNGTRTFAEACAEEAVETVG